MELNKDKTALILLDFQNDLVDEKGKAAGFGIAMHAGKLKTIENTKKLLDKARSMGVKIVFVKVEYEEGYPETVNAKAPIYKGMSQMGVMIKDSWGAQICDELKPLDGETIISKSRINAFTSPLFRESLKGIDHLIFAGVATNFAVEAAVREAADRDFAVIVVKDCCASMNDDMHDFALNNILPNLGDVLDLNGVLKML